MLIVKVKSSIEGSLKLLKRKFRETGIVDELRERQQFTKKSKKKRLQIQKAKYNQIKKELKKIKFEGLTELKNKTGDKFTYSELHIVLQDLKP